MNSGVEVLDALEPPWGGAAAEENVLDRPWVVMEEEEERQLVAVEKRYRLKKESPIGVMEEEERLAWDTRLYHRMWREGVPREELEERIAIEAATLKREARILQKEVKAVELITPYHWRRTEDDRVICPEFGDVDVIEMLSMETDVDRQESRALLRMREAMLTRVDPYVGVWISPAEAYYGETRWVLMLSDGKGEAEMFGIRPDSDRIDGVEIAARLAGQLGLEMPLRKAGTVRETPLLVEVKNREESWRWLRREIPELGGFWQVIDGGELEQVWQADLADTRKLARKVVDHMELTAWMNDQAVLAMGMMVEDHFGNQGMNWHNSGCGMLSSQLKDRMKGGDVMLFGNDGVWMNGNQQLEPIIVGKYVRGKGYFPTYREQHTWVEGKLKWKMVVDQKGEIVWGKYMKSCPVCGHRYEGYVPSTLGACVGCATAIGVKVWEC